MIAFKKILDFVIKNRKVLFYVSVGIVVMLYLRQCNETRNLEAEKAAIEKKNTQNLTALTDTIAKYKDKNGKIGYKKSLFNMTPDELKKADPELYEAVKSESGKPKIVYKTKIEYRDTGSSKNILKGLGQDQYSLSFDYVDSDSILSVKGRSLFIAKALLKDAESGLIDLNITPGITYFDNIGIRFGITTGVTTDKDGIDRIFVKTNSDKIIITDIKGADLNDYIKGKSLKQKKFGFGPYLGAGFNFDKDGVVKVGGSLGVCLSYSWFRF